MRRARSTGSVHSSPLVTCAETKDYWRQFCVGTPIHGVKYLVDTERPIYERLWWAGVLVVCLYFATAYSLELWFRLTVKPTDFTTHTVTRYEDIINIPLPALTFCDNVKSTDTNMTKEATYFLCGQDDEEFEVSKSIDILILNRTAPAWNSSCSMIHRHIPEVENFFTDCNKMFTRIVTQHGVCYTFNMLESSEIFREGVTNQYSNHGRLSDWDPEAGYREGAPLADKNGSSSPLEEGPYPKRANSWIVTFQFWPATSGAFCAEDGPGLKVAVHNPAEMPRIGHRNNLWLPVKNEDMKDADYLNLAIGNEYYIDVDPEYSWTDNILKYIPTEQRRCYFSGERTLRYFKFYSETNCESECLINATLNDCQCVDFYMPYFNNTRICNAEDFICVIDTLEWWKKRGKRNCDCMRPCKNLKYNNDIYSMRREHSQKKKMDQNSIKITLYLTDELYVSKEQKKIQTPYFLVDFVANCGGVFGLFCGLSIVSLVELVYYGTIRLSTNFYRRRRRKDPEGV